MEIGDYTVIKSLGEGSFGEIFLGSKKESTEKYVIKTFDKSKLTTEVRKYFDNELSILKDINHPNIIKFYEVEEKEKEIYVIEEFCNGGALSKFLEYYLNEKKEPFSEEMVQHIMRQLIDAVKYLHDKKLMHRDLKSENILLHYEDKKSRENKDIMKAQIKIIDFGFARYLKEGELAKTILGSPLNMSPYILNGLISTEKNKKIGYNEKEEIWTLGTICYELLTGETLFNAVDIDDLAVNINKGDYYLPLTLSKEAISFLNCMLQYYSENRLSAAQLSKHDFLIKNVSEFKKVDIKELKNVKVIIKPTILINTKENESIWENFGKGIEDTDNPFN